MPKPQSRQSPGGVTAVGSALLLTVLSGPPMLVAMEASAEEARTDESTAQQFEIPPGSLDRALNALAERAGLVLASDASLTAGKTSPGLEGRYTVPQALTRLLTGTGLDYRLTGDDTVILERADGPERLEAIQVEAVPQIDVYARDERYRVNSSSFALGGTDELLQETPFSVSPLEGDFLGDVDPQQLDDIADYAPGVQRGNQVNNTSQVFQSRGFQLGRDSILINGTQQSDAFAITPTEIVSAVEFYRGPASVLSGQAPPGGAANIVTKKPLTDPFTDLTGTFDQHGQRKVALDYNTGRLGDGGLSATFRLNVVAEDSDTFRDEVEREVGVIAPVATLELTPRTRLTLEANLIDWEATDDRGLPLFGADTDDAAADRFDQSDFVLGTTDEANDREEERFLLDLSHEFNRQLATNFQLSYGESERSQFAVFPAGINPANGLLVRSHFGTRDKFESLDARLDTEFGFDTGAVSHSGIAALQVREFERRDEFTGFVAQADQVDPDDPPADSEFLGFGPGGGLQLDQDSTELFLQDRIRLNEGPLAGAFTVVGVRHIAFEDNLDSARDEDENVWRVGLGYTPPAARWFTVYANHAESFNPQSGVTAAGDPLAPSEGEQTEFGVKVSLLGDALLVSAAVFDLERSNVGVADPAVPGAQVSVGKQENQGLELEAVGELTEHLRLRAQYTHNDSEISDDPQFGGNDLQLTPDDSASVWLTRDAVPLPGDRGGLTLGGGLVHVGDRFATTENAIELDSYTRLDLKARYSFGPETVLDVNIENVTDEEYFVGGNTFGLGSVLPGQTRTLGLELSHRF